jgi:hypothetical protein
LHDRENIKDEDILPLIQQTIDASDPGRWYNALDYGAMLKREQGILTLKERIISGRALREFPNRQIRGGF